MNTMKLFAAAMLALAAGSTAASAFDLQAGGQPKFKATKAQLGIISPADGVCPGNAKLTAWVFSNKPGTVDVMLVRKGGGVLGPYSVTTKKGSGGVVMGSMTTGFAIDAPTNAEYRIVVAGGVVASNWVPLTACI
jgi:hypothetical protein